MLKTKLIYIGIISALTSTTLTATYWQLNRYKQSTKRWNTIKTELINDSPNNLLQISYDQMYPYKYVQVEGQLNRTAIYLVKRSKDTRTGFLILRPIKFTNGKWMIALEGWIPQTLNLSQIQNKNSLIDKYKGLLRIGEKKTKYDKEIDNIQSHIDLDEATKKFMSNNSLNYNEQNLISKYYLQILKPIKSNSQSTYPYQYSIDNFQMPYLTPSKHRDYATFWGCTSLVGVWAIFKVLKM